MAAEEPIETEEHEPGPGIPEVIPDVMDEDDLCALLNISHTTARRLRRAHKLGHCKYGVRILYRRHHVLAFLDAHEVPATEDRQPGTVLQMAHAR